MDLFTIFVVVVAVIWFVLSGVFYFIFEAIDLDPILGPIVGLIVTILIIWLKYKFTKPMDTSKFIEIDEKNETAIVRQRSALCSIYLKCESVYSANFKFVPSETRYAGSTVGGIHTGGFYNTEAYIHEYGGKKSDKSHVFVKNSNREVIEIKKIKLSSELLTLAKQDKRIKPFIEDDYISLRHKGEDTELTQMEQEVMKQAVLVQDKAMMYNITQRAFLAGYLNTSDVKYILSWLQGDDK